MRARARTGEKEEGSAEDERLARRILFPSRERGWQEEEDDEKRERKEGRENFLLPCARSRERGREREDWKAEIEREREKYSGKGEVDRERKEREIGRTESCSSVLFSSLFFVFFFFYFIFLL